jgi:hypothetical protein
MPEKLPKWQDRPATKQELAICTALLLVSQLITPAARELFSVKPPTGNGVQPYTQVLPPQTTTSPTPSLTPAIMPTNPATVTLPDGSKIDWNTKRSTPLAAPTVPALPSQKPEEQPQ